jgi:hypothetical protein
MVVIRLVCQSAKSAAEENGDSSVLACVADGLGSSEGEEKNDLSGQATSVFSHGWSIKHHQPFSIARVGDWNCEKANS